MDYKATINIMPYNADKFGYVPKNPTGQDNKEVKQFDRANKEDFEVYDPYHKPLEGVVNVPGSDVVDQATYYNEPGFEGFADQEDFNDLIDDSEKGGEIGGLMEKYGLEEFELAKLMADCESYLNGKKIPAPLKSKEDLREMATFYREYLKTKNEYGLPFSDQELEKISEADGEKLANLYEEKTNLIFKIAENNSLLHGLKIEEEGVVVPKPNYIYSTAGQEKSLEDNQPAGQERKGPAVSLRPEIRYKKEQEEKLRNLEEIKKQIIVLEAPIYKTAPKIDSDREQMLQDAKNDYINLWQDRPKYSEEELALRKSVVDYANNRNNKTKPVLADGEKLSEVQILEILREAAEDEKWPKAKFFEEIHDGKRQLSFAESLGEGKRIKYTFKSESLPAGQYYFEADPKLFFRSEKNPNSAIAPIRLFISVEKSNHAVSESSGADSRKESADKPKIVVKKQTPEENKLKEESKPKIVVKKQVPVPEESKPKIVVKKRTPETVV